MNVAGSEFPIVIVGAGFAGLGMGIELKRAGIESFVILEKAGEVGGTWRDNQYPGCACDVPSHLYSFSFEPNPDWSRAYSPQPEIWAYLKRCTDKYGLRPHIRFNTEMVRATFDATDGCWRIDTGVGQPLLARALILGTGGLSRPALPQIKGLERFQGKAFHSQQWDHGSDLRSKRVAVIGTGASAIQFVPQIAPLVQRLDLYQRTPPWILPRTDRAYSARTRARLARFPLLQRLLRGLIYSLMELRVLPFVIQPRLMRYVQRMAERHLQAQISDPELRQKLTPNYLIGCKRILISDDYYPALTRANVQLITVGIREVRAHSIVASDGSERDVDVIIYGTGFRATDLVERDTIKGRGGRDIWDAWRDGPEAFLGTTVAGFPNLFMIVGPNTGLGHNSMVYMIESQLRYIVDALRVMQRQRWKWVDVRPDVQARYNRELQARARTAIWSVGGCKSWYLDANGKNVTLWPGSTLRFRRLTRRFDPAQYLSEQDVEAAALAYPDEKPA